MRDGLPIMPMMLPIKVGGQAVRCGGNEWFDSSAWRVVVGASGVFGDESGH